MADGEKWYYAKNGERYGPVSESQIKNLIADGTVLRGTTVWKKGFPKWRYVENTELAAYLPGKDTSADIQERRWYNSEDGRRKGPFDENKFIEMIKSGALLQTLRMRTADKKLTINIPIIIVGILSLIIIFTFLSIFVPTKKTATSFTPRSQENILEERMKIYVERNAENYYTEYSFFHGYDRDEIGAITATKEDSKPNGLEFIFSVEVQIKRGKPSIRALCYIEKKSRNSDEYGITVDFAPWEYKNEREKKQKLAELKAILYW